MNMLVQRKEVVQRAKSLRYKDEIIKNIDTEYPRLVVCKSCKKPMEKETLKENNFVCPSCNYHSYIDPLKRLDLIFDFVRIINYKDRIDNPINFPGYEEKKNLAKEKSNLNEAVVIAKVKLGDFEAYCFVMDKNFMMASMGVEVGERISRCFELAQKEKLPVIGFTASGGARMQEGIFSLMQMANTSFAIKNFSNDGNLFVAVLTNPTTGGVLASFASLADITIAEPNATIGFTGRRVIEQTLNQKLDDNFQTSKFQLDHGFLDDIVNRSELKNYLKKVLEYHL